MWGIESDEFITWDREMKNSRKQHRYLCYLLITVMRKLKMR